MVSLIDDAVDHVHFILAEGPALEDSVLDRLSAASDRGVTVCMEVPSESIQNRVQQTIPDAQVIAPIELRETHRVVKKWPGQLIMVDDQLVLASGIEKSDLPQMEQETTVWSHGRDHGFAAWMRELLQERVARTQQST